jgi:hypothetical protein
MYRRFRPSATQDYAPPADEFSAEHTIHSGFCRAIGAADCRPLEPLAQAFGGNAKRQRSVSQRHPPDPVG